MLWATSSKWTEHRRALLVHAGSDKAHAAKLKELEKTLQSKGFVTQLIGNNPQTDGVTYEKWVRSIPTMGVSVFYYLGRLETKKSPDGKSVCHSMQMGGYKVLPPARDPSLGRSRAEDKPWLSLERLSQKLSYNVARANLVVIDCLGIDDKAETGKSKADLFAQASGQFRGELFSSFYPGKAAFHPSLEAPSYGPFMADELIKSMRKDGPLTPRIDKIGYTVTPRDKTFELKHGAAEVCSPPEKLREGRFAGDQWVDQEIIWRAKPEAYINGAEVGMGARIAFDNAGYVYLTLGNMLANYAGAQDLDKPYGKILRLHDDGRIPSDNPFFDNKKALPSIWTLGHRNPQGISFDKKQNVLWQSEHGPRGGDEANVLLPGRNYGWPLVSLGLDYDGAPIHYGEQLGIKFDPKNLTPTKIDWTPSLGVSSIAFYQLKDSDGFDNINEASTYFSKWQNDLLVATLASNDLLRVTTDKDEIISTEIIVKDIGRIRDVEPGWNGEIYLLLEHSTGSTIIIMQQADQPKKAS